MLDSILNEIANSVVLIDPNDLVELRQLLELINTIDEPDLDAQVFTLGDVTERMILDDFDTPELAMQALNEAVIDLQEAYKRLTQ
ncbi:hypothetical protein RZS08_40295, partial [Arthrospira platensis SPKY1]|nr:hypothetical protein [Arthrospira platensis SPKY1]